MPDIRKHFKESKKAKRVKEMKMKKLNEIRFLNDICQVPIKTIASRLNMNYHKLKRLLHRNV